MSDREFQLTEPLSAKILDKVVEKVQKCSTLYDELANTVNGSVSHNDTQSFSQQRGGSSQQQEFGDFNNENAIPRQDRLLESMEMNMRLSQEMDSLMSIMHTQINGLISNAISERVIPEIQYKTLWAHCLQATGTLSLGH